MGCLEARRRLIVNADDFGRSRSINQAVIDAHQNGILTTASLMVNGQAFDDAVALAHKNPRLGVGLHLTLVCGNSSLSQEEIPGLITHSRCFSDNPVKAGIAYFFRHSLRSQLVHEIGAQFEKFRTTGLALDHVNGHLNIHLHPTVFGILIEKVSSWSIRRMRLTHDRLWLNLRLARGRLAYRLSHAVIFGLLSVAARPKLKQLNIRHTNTVFGLLQTGAVDEDYVLGLLPRLPQGDSELYSHPSLDEFKHEADALVSQRVRQTVTAQKIELIRYQDL